MWRPRASERWAARRLAMTTKIPSPNWIRLETKDPCGEVPSATTTPACTMRRANPAIRAVRSERILVLAYFGARRGFMQLTEGRAIGIPYARLKPAGPLTHENHACGSTQ